MTERPASTPSVGLPVVGSDRRAIGRVDAVFADYLLVRTHGFLPVDLYVPRPAVTAGEGGRLQVEVDRAEAYRRWHRPLRAAPHD